MAKKAKKETAPSEIKPPTKKEIGAIIERFLKKDQPIYWPREMVAFYRLWKQYPNKLFWQTYELPFGDGVNGLNMMTWFDTAEGQLDLGNAWLLFNYNPPAPIENTTIDNSSQVVYDVPAPVIDRSPKTLAQFLKKS